VEHLKLKTKGKQKSQKERLEDNKCPVCNGERRYKKGKVYIICPECIGIGVKPRTVYKKGNTWLD
jgi:DnaJ-class molecular chaperone